MTLEKCKIDMQSCSRCSACKFIPLELVKGIDNDKVCPSVERYQFHAYSGGGRMAIGLSMLEGRLSDSDDFKDIVYNCQMCGACDVSCKYGMDMDVLEPLYQTRIRLVEQGMTLMPLDSLVENLKTNGTMTVHSGTERGGWRNGLDLKLIPSQKAEVVYFPGCRTELEPQNQKTALSTMHILKEAGVDFGVFENNSCCGGRAYHMGYEQAFITQAEKLEGIIAGSGAKTLVTSCAECYNSLKVLYKKVRLELGVQVLHTSEYFAMLIREGKLALKRPVDMTVTYHDPCHLGRLGETYIPWDGELHSGHIRLFDPPREFMRGTHGIYDAPRDILMSIPGLRLIEMDRIKEYAWCCGSGGGVKESNHDFASWTADKRLEEAESTGAEALVTACPGCMQSFSESRATMPVLDIAELLERAI